MDARDQARDIDGGELARLKRALRAAADDPVLLATLAEELASHGMIEPARRAYGRALELAPDLSIAHRGLGRLALATGNAPAALAAFHRALRVDPRARAVRLDMAKAFEALGCPLAAAACRAPRTGADHQATAVLIETARGLSLAGLHDEALAALSRLSPADRNVTDALLIGGHAHSACGRWDEAVETYRTLVGAAPELAEGWANLGGSLLILGALDQAESALRRALALAPAFAPPAQNLANLLIETHRHDEALALIRDMLAREPERPELHNNLANLLLLLGRFAEGWDAYEWRRRVAHGAPPALPLPEWRGEPLAGRALHVIAEQAPGDVVMFASCLPELSGLDGPLHLHCEPRLVGLFRRSFPDVDVSAALPDGANGGRAILLGSLPRLFRRHATDFGAPRAFLRPDDAAVRHWRARFAALGEGLRIGISWRGGKDPVNRRQRTMALEDWLPLLALPGVVAIDLQYRSSQEEADRLRAAHGVTLHRFHDEVDPMTDLDGLVAQTAALDLVVSVCNTTAHMAGAAGAPVLALAPHAPSWRWQLERTDCLWYPDVALLRQGPNEPWAAVLARAAEAIATRADAVPSSSTRQILPGNAAREAADSAARAVNAKRGRNAAAARNAATSLVNECPGTNLAF